MAPLKFGDFEMQEKAEYEYLGDIISSGGLSALFEATIARRLFKTNGSIYKTDAIMKDFRMQVVAGMAKAFGIWERAIIPSLLANCCSWGGIRERVLKTLDGLENLFCKLVNFCPGSSPFPALCGQAGLISMDFLVLAKKVCLVSRIFQRTAEQEEI